MNTLVSTVLAADEVVDIEPIANAGNFFGYTCIANLVSNIVSVALIIASVTFFILLVWAGIDWLTSGGDKARVESAQKRITNALIGIIIVASSWALYQLVLNFLGVNLQNICSPNPVG